VTVDVEYARRGDICIAYQAIGDGPVDIIFGAGLVSHLDLVWADPYATAFLRELTSIGRVLLFDKPGTGLSDPVAGSRRCNSARTISSLCSTRPGRDERLSSDIQRRVALRYFSPRLTPSASRP